MDENKIFRLNTRGAYQGNNRIMARNRPMRISAVVAVALLCLVVFAGCLSTDEAPDLNQEQRDPAHEPVETKNGPGSGPGETGGSGSAPVKQEASGSGTGTLWGEVFNDGYDPVQGAAVRLFNTTATIANVTTDAEGKYRMEGLPEGRFNLEVYAECCRTKVAVVDIEPRRSLEMNLVLEFWSRASDPYVVEHEWTGMISCRFEVWIFNFDAFGEYCEEFSANHDDRQEFVVDPGIRSIVVAVDWDGGINVRDCHSLRVYAYEVSTQNPIHGSGDCQGSPIEMRLDAGTKYHWNEAVTDRYDLRDIEEAFPLQWHITSNAGGDEFSAVPPRVNLVYEQSFTVYWKEYYWELAPEDASAMPG